MTEELRNSVLKAMDELTSIGGILNVLAGADISGNFDLCACDIDWLGDQQHRIISDLHALVSKRGPAARPD